MDNYQYHIIFEMGLFREISEEARKFDHILIFSSNDKVECDRLSFSLNKVFRDHEKLQKKIQEDYELMYPNQ